MWDYSILSGDNCCFSLPLLQGPRINEGIMGSSFGLRGEDFDNTPNEGTWALVCLEVVAQEDYSTWQVRQDPKLQNLRDSASVVHHMWDHRWRLGRGNCQGEQLGIKPKLSRPDEAALELVLGFPGRVLGCIITQRKCRAYRSGFRAQGRLHITCHHRALLDTSIV